MQYPSSQLISDTVRPYGSDTEGEVRRLETMLELDLGTVTVFVGGELEGQHSALAVVVMAAFG